jgi:tRNA threonylcarbamoyladenosine biosynthesis protein TsaE
VVARLPAGDLDATAAVAGVVGDALRPGDVVLLDGELGAGKTTFTQALARHLGVTDAVTSPTFVLVHSYRTTAGFELLHADVYRLGHLSEVADLGLAEEVDAGAVAVVEWGDRARGALPGEHLSLRFSLLAAAPRPVDADDHLVVIRPRGPSWRSRWPGMRHALAATGLVDDPGDPPTVPSTALSRP